QGASGTEGRHLRRARRRTFQCYVLPPRRHGLCQLFSLSNTDSASGCRSGRDRGKKEFTEAKSKGVSKAEGKSKGEGKSKSEKVTQVINHKAPDRKPLLRLIK